VAIIVITPDKKLLLQLRDNKPNIEYPGYWSCITGWIENSETPAIAAMRELSEEIVTRDGSDLRFGSIDLLGACDRMDRPWTEYVFKVTINKSEKALKITEGQCLRAFTLDECIRLNKLAPHHWEHLTRHLSQL
jgi:ADP-ribose pyrophosphatase YjhB (NUDIX family)